VAKLQLLAAVRAARPRPAHVRRAAKGGQRDPGSLDEMSGTLLAHVKSNPGQRGEIAEALGTDVGTMRLPMKKQERGRVAARQDDVAQSMADRCHDPRFDRGRVAAQAARQFAGRALVEEGRLLLENVAEHVAPQLHDDALAGDREQGVAQRERAVLHQEDRRHPQSRAIDRRER